MLILWIKITKEMMNGWNCFIARKYELRDKSLLENKNNLLNK